MLNILILKFKNSLSSLKKTTFLSNLINYVPYVSKFFLYTTALLSVTILPLNFYLISMYIMPAIRSQHILLTSDYNQMAIVIFAIVTWVVVLLFKRPGLIKIILGLFGPLSLMISSCKFMYVFNTTRSLYSDSMFFKLFGFAFYHEYSRSEYIRYAYDYLKNHNALTELYFKIPTLFDSNSISTMKEWTELLNKLLSNKTEDVLTSPVTFMDHLNNVFNTCASFAYSHPYLVGGTVLICGSLLIGYFLWKSGSISPILDNNNTINQSQLQCISNLGEATSDLYQRDELVLQETQRALTNINSIYSNFREFIKFGSEISRLACMLGMLQLSDNTFSRKNLRESLKTVALSTKKIIGLLNKDEFPSEEGLPILDHFPAPGYSLGYASDPSDPSVSSSDPLLQTRAARLEKFDKKEEKE